MTAHKRLLEHGSPIEHDGTAIGFDSEATDKAGMPVFLLVLIGAEVLALLALAYTVFAVQFGWWVP